MYKFSGQSLARHYISGALFRSHWVVGSLDLIGSPSGFTRTVGEGVKDFVAMPYQGIFQGPWSFVSGLTSGSSSLVKHVSAGLYTNYTFYIQYYFTGYDHDIVKICFI